MKIHIVDHAKRRFYTETLVWALTVALLALSLNQNRLKRATEGLIESTEARMDVMAGDTIVVLEGKVLGVGCFRVIPSVLD